MVKVSMEVRSGAARFNVAVQTESLQRAVSFVEERYLKASVKLRSPIEPEGCFVEDPSARGGKVGLELPAGGSVKYYGPERQPTEGQSEPYGHHDPAFGFPNGSRTPPRTKQAKKGSRKPWWISSLYRPLLLRHSELRRQGPRQEEKHTTDVNTRPLMHNQATSWGMDRCS